MISVFRPRNFWWINKNPRLAIACRKGIYLLNLEVDPTCTQPQLNFSKSFIPNQIKPSHSDKKFTQVLFRIRLIFEYLLALTDNRLFVLFFWFSNICIIFWFSNICRVCLISPRILRPGFYRTEFYLHWAQTRRA